MNKIAAKISADMFLNKLFALLIGFALLFAYSGDEPNALIYSVVGAPFVALFLFPVTIPLAIFATFIFRKLFQNAYKRLVEFYFITHS